MKPKKLLVDAHTFDENYQGIRTFLKGIYSTINIDANDLQIILVAHDIVNLKKEFKHQKNFSYIKLNSKNRYIRLAFEIPRLIKKHGIDFAHFNYYLPLFLNKKCNYIVTIHDVLFIDFPQFFPLKYRVINKYLFKRSAIKAQVLTTVSEYSAKRLKHHFKITDKQIIILPNAISKFFLLERDKIEDFNYINETYNVNKFILYVSRIEPRKNHVRLLKIYKDLKLWEQNIDLVLIGKESFENKKLKAAINDINSNTSGNVVRFESMNGDELIKFYNAAQLTVFISLCEGFGIPPIESAVLKTPTICSNTTALGDFNFFGNYLVDPRSDKQIKNKILEILNPDNKLITINNMESISEIIKEKYNWSKTSLILKKILLT